MVSTLIIIIVALGLSALFSGMEIAFNSSNRLRAEIDNRSHSFGGKILSRFYKNSGQFISTMLVGNNIVIVIYSIAMAKILEPLIASFVPNLFFITLIQTILATIIVLIAGEFIPKTVFSNNSNLWLKVFSPLIFIFYITLYPVAWFSTHLAIGILRIFGIKINAKSRNNVFNKVDLNYLLEESIEKKSESEIENELKIFRNALDFSSVKLRECIVPRTEITALDIENSSFDDLRNAFVETGYSKILIYRDNIDNIIGYIHSSDFFEQTENWRTLLRKIPVVPETMAANKLMHSLLQEKKSIAVVIDEFGGTAGIVTLEDIIEEIFGEIEDEHDINEYILRQVSDNEYLISGRLEIDTINRQLNLDLPENDEYVTLAGFLLYHYQKFPKLNDIITIKNWTFKVIQATNNRIELVKFSSN
ncbi:MAG: hemolysin family protein [Prevotellaceae bacterium]|jgi:CBS domain containing-hemolysin-like protein|nr:hemolysin family protein [Prevotellaceae bacterium]